MGTHVSHNQTSEGDPSQPRSRQISTCFGLIKEESLATVQEINQTSSKSRTSSVATISHHDDRAHSPTAAHIAKHTITQLTPIERAILRESWKAVGEEGQKAFLLNAFTLIMTKSKHIRTSFGVHDAETIEQLRQHSVVHAHVARFQKFLHQLLKFIANEEGETDDEMGIKLCQRTGAAHRKVGKLAWGQDSFQIFISSLCHSFFEQSKFKSVEDGQLVFQVWDKTFHAVVDEMRQSLYRAETRHHKGLLHYK